MGAVLLAVFNNKASLQKIRVLSLMVLVLQKARNLVAQLGSNVVVGHVGSQHPKFGGLIFLDFAQGTGQAGDGTHQGGVGHQGSEGHDHEEGDLQGVGGADGAQAHTQHGKAPVQAA